jgi:type II secretory pathway pseudopilin PulG
MWLGFGSRSPQRGFTLAEVLISLFSVAIILILAGQTLFAARRASQRQQFGVEARQTARSALDYVTFMLRGAADLNTSDQSPSSRNASAIVAWFWAGIGGGNVTKPCPGTAGCYQASVDNNTDATLGDLETDIVTIARPDNVQKIAAVRWPGFSSASTVAWLPPFGCPPLGSGDAEAMNYFKQVTGVHKEEGVDVSSLMVLVDSLGRYGFYRITSYDSVSCTASNSCLDPDNNPRPCIRVSSAAGTAAGMNPPGLQSNLTPPVTLMAGVRFSSLRVRDGWLEQKEGIFDPRVDNPGTNFVQLLPGIEDLQVAYIFRDGSIWNTASQTLPAAQQMIPRQAGVGGVPAATDVVNIMAFRVTITARSTAQFPLETPRFTWPDAENHRLDAGSKPRDSFYRYQASSIAIVRNRAPEG